MLAGSLRISLLAVSAALLAGCQSSSPVPASPPGPTQIDLTQRDDSQTALGEPMTPDAIVSADPAATRLQDIGGFLLLYYTQHKQLPATLDELTQMPGGDSLDLTAPRSGRPFGYAPTGLWSQEHPGKCIVAFDPDRRAQARWCLFMTPPTNEAALVVTVLAVSEETFEKYHPAGQ